MLGLCQDNEADYSSLCDYVSASAETSPDLLSDGYDLESLMADEGNTYSSVTLAHHINNLRVQVRRKTFGNNWGGLSLPADETCQLCKTNFISRNNILSDNNIQKDYLIKLRRFII